MATSKVIRPQNLNNVFQQVAEQAAMKTPELSHNQQVSTNCTCTRGHRTPWKRQITIFARSD